MNLFKMLTLSLAVVLLGGAQCAFATERTWKGGASGDWNTAANWEPSGVPTAGDTALFTSGATISSAINVGSGSETFTLSVDSGQTVTLSGVISGSAPIKLEGAGTLTLSGANTFTGALEGRINQLNVTGDNALGATTAAAKFYKVAGYSSSTVCFTDFKSAKDIWSETKAANNGAHFVAKGACEFRGIVAPISNYTLRFQFSAGSTTVFASTCTFGSANTFVTDNSVSSATVQFDCNVGFWTRLNAGTYIFNGKVKPTTSAFFNGADVTVKFGNEDAFVWTDGTTIGPVIWSASGGTLDLNGYDQRISYLKGDSSSAASKITSTAGAATLRIVAPASVGAAQTFKGAVTGPVSLSVESSKLPSFTLTGVSTADGTLSAKNGGHIIFSGSGAWKGHFAPVEVTGAGSVIDVVSSGTFGEGASVSVSDGGKINLGEGVTQVVGFLTLGGNPAERGKTYGSTASAATVKDDTYFSGTGVISVTGPVRRTWVGAASGGAFDGAANWNPAGCPDLGDALAIDASTEAMTFANGTAGLTVSDIVLTGGKNVTFTGEKVVVKPGSTVSSTGAGGATVTFGLPLELAGGMVTFTSVSNVLGGAVYDFTGVISGAGGLATGGDHSGTYHFRGENTYDGKTYLTNALAYHLWSDGALGSAVGDTYYRVPTGLRAAPGAGNQSDRMGAPLYFHGIDTSESFTVWGDQSHDLDVAEGTVNVIRGTVTSANVGNVERWWINRNAKLTITGTVTLTSTAQLNVLAGGLLRFEGPVVAAALRSAPYSTARCEFANTISLGSEKFVVYQTGVTAIMKADAFGPSGGIVSFENAANGTLELSGGHQVFSKISGVLTRNVTSSDGTVLELKSSDTTLNSTFTGDVSLQVDAGTLTLTAASETTGTLIATNGGSVVCGPNAVWSGGIAVGDGSSVTINRDASLAYNAAVSIADAGKLVLANGTSQSVGTLTIAGATAQETKKYGADGATADIVDAVHFGGSGTIEMAQTFGGVTRTWKGTADAKWGTPANWEPSGVPSGHDKLVFDASAGDLELENDIDGLVLEGLTLSGGHTVTLTGKPVTIYNHSTISAAGAMTVNLDLRLDIDAGSVTISATSDTSGHVVWNLNGGLSGAGDLMTDGDYSAEYHFTANSPDYDGNLHLVNGSAYHVYENQSLGSTAGYTRYEVRIGDDGANANVTVSAFVFHGVKIDENFLWAGWCSHSLRTADGSTNVFNGTFDHVKGASGSPVERWDFGARSRTVFNGDIGMESLPDDGDTFSIILFLGGDDTVVDVNGQLACKNNPWRMNLTGTGVFNLNRKVPSTAYGVGTFASGTLALGVAEAFADVRFCFGSRFSHIDLNGFDQTMSSFYAYNGNIDAIIDTAVTSAKPAKLKVTQAENDLQMAFAGCASLELASGGSNTVCGANSSTGTLAVTSGSLANMTTGGQWSRAVVADGSTLVLRAKALADDAQMEVADGGCVELAAGVRQVVSSLTLGGTAQDAFRSYGSSASDADVKDDAHFAGEGIVYVAQELGGIERTWKGSNIGGSLADADSWEPKGAPQSGDTLTFAADDADISLVNDLPGDVMLGGLNFTGSKKVTVSGTTPIRLVDLGTGVAVGTGVQVDVLCGISGVKAGADSVIVLSAAADAVLTFNGAISGNASYLACGTGVVRFKGANTFTGALEVKECQFHAWGDSPFGTADGKTVFTFPSGTACSATFHGITTDDPIEWYQPDGAYRGFFASGTTNVFNGLVKGTSGQPRWEVQADALAKFTGGLEGVGTLTLSTDARAVVDFDCTVGCGQPRITGFGTLHLRDTMTMTSDGYGFLWNTGAPKAVFHKADIFRSSSAEYYGGTLMLEFGTLDLNGTDQWASCFGGKSGTTVTSEGPATLHVLQSHDVVAESTKPLSISRFGFSGAFTGAASLSVEGLVSADKTPVVMTQLLASVSTSVGTLTATNGAIVRLAKGAGWRGEGAEVDIRGGSEVIVAGSAFDRRNGVLRIFGDGRLTLDGNAKVGELWIDGERMPNGTYGATDGAEFADDVHFAGGGILRVGPQGSLLIVK